MSHSQTYITVPGAMGAEQAVAAGCTGAPELVTSGGIASSAASLTFSTDFLANDTVTFGGVTLTAVAANPNALQFVPSGVLATTLGNLVTQLQALPQPVPGTYSQNGTVLTFTPGYGVTTSYTTALPDVTAKAVQAAGGNTVAYANGVTTQNFVNNFAPGDTITFSGLTFTAVAFGGPVGLNQFVPDVTLLETMGQLVGKFRNFLGGTVGQFSNTGTSLSFAPTPVKSTAAYAVSAVKTSGGTNTAVQSNNLGSPLIYLSLDTEHSQLNSAIAGQTVFLNDGVESQRKTVANLGTGTFDLKFAHAPTGVTTQIALAATDVVTLQFLAAKWRLLFNDGGVIS